MKHEEERVRQTFDHVQEKNENFVHFQKTESLIIVVWRFRVCMKTNHNNKLLLANAEKTRCIIVVVCCCEFMGNI